MEENKYISSTMSNTFKNAEKKIEESNIADVNRLVSSNKTSSDQDIENILRPTKLQDYIGQKKIKENIKVYIDAAKSRGEVLDHVLLYGPAGLGKTTLSYIIATEMESQIKITSGPAIERAADLAAILTGLNKNDVLFIDEIHRLNKSIEEILYPAMEDFAIDFIVGKGPTAKSMRLKLQPFTLIGATTKIGQINSPLRDRFGVVEKLEMYSMVELATIIKRSCKILNIEIEEDASLELARRSRGTPRLANRLVKRIRDFAQVQGDGKITIEVCKSALTKMGIDDLGLDETDIKILSFIINKFKGGPVGIDTISALCNEESDTIEDVYEPYLMQIGFLDKTMRGRVCTDCAREHLEKLGLLKQ